MEVSTVKLGCFRHEERSDRVTDRFYVADFGNLPFAGEHSEINSRNSYVLFRFPAGRRFYRPVSRISRMFDFGFGNVTRSEPRLTSVQFI